MLDKGKSGRLADNKMIREATNYNNYMYMNLSFDKFPKSTQQNIKDQLQGKFGKLQESLSLFENFKARGKDYQARMELNLSDKSKNSLEVILRTVWSRYDYGGRIIIDLIYIDVVVPEGTEVDTR